MVLLRFVELRQLFDLRNDSVGEYTGLVELFDVGLGDYSLIIAMIENARAILRADVKSLFVQGRGVVRLKKHFE